MILQIVISVFFAFGVIDHFFGNRLKMGQEFYKGLSTFPSLILGMLGIYSLSPILGEGIQFIFSPIINLTGVDPAFFPSMLLSVDMGGYTISQNVGATPETKQFYGIILASLFGSTLSFSLPMGLSILQPEDHGIFMKGFILGMISLPFGAAAGGLAQGLPILMVLPLALPLLLFSALLGILFFWKEKLVIGFFKILQYILKAIGTIGLILQGFRSITGIVILQNMISLEDSFLVVSKIALFLGGVYGLTHVLHRMLSRYLTRIGERFRLTENTLISLLGNFVSNLVIFSFFDQMPKRDKLLCATLSVSAAFTIGGQLAYVSSVEPDMIPVYLFSKLVCTIVSLLLFAGFNRRLLDNE